MKYIPRPEPFSSDGFVHPDPSGFYMKMKKAFSSKKTRRYRRRYTPRVTHYRFSNTGPLASKWIHNYKLRFYWTIPDDVNFTLAPNIRIQGTDWDKNTNYSHYRIMGVKFHFVPLYTAAQPNPINEAGHKNHMPNMTYRSIGTLPYDGDFANLSPEGSNDNRYLLLDTYKTVYCKNGIGIVYGTDNPSDLRHIYAKMELQLSQ